MSQSRRHRQLISRISSIESHLLPAPKLNGYYTKKESDLIRSYILLSHAEIESYFEDIAEAKITKSLLNWSQTRKRSNCLLALMAFCSEEITWEKIQRRDKEQLAWRLNTIARHFKNKLKSNHGIKSKNILNILLPIGIESHELDQSWLNTMDSFGSKRGELAHTASRVQSQIDLVSEKNNINNSILPEISNIDVLVKKIT